MQTALFKSKRNYAKLYKYLFTCIQNEHTLVVTLALILEKSTALKI